MNAAKSKTTKTLSKQPPATKAKKKPAAGKSPRPKAKAAKIAKLSAIDAAAKVLTESKEPLTTRELIALMADRKLWTSPAGKTPERTLYSALTREINAKGKDARFVKTDRGRFRANG
jgi:hypothetical protein